MDVSFKFYISISSKILSKIILEYKAFRAKSSNLKKKNYFFINYLWVIIKNYTKKIIYCSEKSINFHQNSHFYSKKKTKLIYNGYNEKSYFPATQLRSKFRKKYKINKSDIIIGYAGRYAKQKNIYSMLLAFSKVSKVNNNIYLYMVGRDMNNYNKALCNFINNLQINKKSFF